MADRAPEARDHARTARARPQATAVPNTDPRSAPQLHFVGAREGAKGMPTVTGAQPAATPEPPGCSRQRGALARRPPGSVSPRLLAFCGRVVVRPADDQPPPPSDCARTARTQPQGCGGRCRTPAAAQLRSLVAAWRRPEADRKPARSCARSAREQLRTQQPVQTSGRNRGAPKPFIHLHLPLCFFTTAP